MEYPFKAGLGSFL